MIFGITGNTRKDNLWLPVAELTAYLQERGGSYLLDTAVAEGLIARGLVADDQVLGHTSSRLPEDADVILSFGGDGTLLNTAHMIGPYETPIMGINIGRLGFLAEVEVAGMFAAIARIEAGDFRIIDRLVLEASIDESHPLQASWALNEIVIERSGTTKLIAIEVTVNGIELNTYWADGLILSTPTGSTAYNLATGGPIVTPGSEVILLTPIAPHMLTVRPLVVPSDATITARVVASQPPFVVAADGISTVFESSEVAITIKRAEHKVKLVRFPEQHFFSTLRSKLMWGQRPAK